MADASKAQKLKLANSRKRFKELQELKKKKQSSTEDAQKPSNEPTPIDSMTSSTHSSINNEIPDFIGALTHSPNTSVTSDNNVYHQPESASFFDDFVQQEQDEIESSFKSFQNENKSNSMSNYFNTSSTKTDFENMVSNIVDSPTESFPNVPVFSSQENYSLFPQDSSNNYATEKTQEHDYLNDFRMDEEKLHQNKSDPTYDINSENMPADSKETCNLSESEIVGASDRTKLEIQHSNVESLKQLSNQMAELIEPEYCPNSGNYDKSITDLEKRNLELATLLDQEKLKFERNVIIVNDLQNKIAHLENLLREKDEASNFESSREIIRLKEELQSHLQTIGLLVAEKTEQSVSLSKLEMCSKQKAAECEELQARLKTSRSRVAELEREVSNFKMEKQHNESFMQESSESINSLKQEFQALKQEKDELVQDLLEAREKLKTSLEENVKLQQLYQDDSSKLALANIKLQQITNSSQQQTDSDLEKIVEEKFQLEKQISDLNQFLKTMTKERDESVLQYQQYAQQQNMQLNSLTKKIEQLQKENENLNIQEQNRIKHISELEKQLQNLQTEQVTLATDRNSDSNSKLELEDARELCVQLQMEKITLEENFTKVSNEKEMLLKELEAKNDSLSQLEALVEQLQGNQPDSVKLLATMESDKVAAARAVQQNKELKQHVESLEEVFLKLNNDKVELTEQVNMEVRSNKELLQKLQKTEIHLQRLTEAVEIKDRELMDLRQDMEKIKKQLFQKEQVNDLIRHYDAQDSSSHALQHELKEAKDNIVKLTNEINILKHRLSEKESIGIIEDKTISNSNQDTESTNDERMKTSDVVVDDNSFRIEPNEIADANQTLDKEMATKCLEEKFKRTMQDIADLKEEKQSLEHLVLQLQGETETIGEYVALYHQQRMVLKQRALEKDQQLKQLTNDREYLKTKLEKLDDYIRKLVDEKIIAADSFSQQGDSVSDGDNFCEKHSKLQEEINKINNEIGGQKSNENTELAGKIISILSEIKSSNLVEPKESVHHCAWCSGQLITV